MQIFTFRTTEIINKTSVWRAFYAAALLLCMTPLSAQHYDINYNSMFNALSITDLAGNSDSLVISRVSNGSGTDSIFIQVPNTLRTYTLNHPNPSSGNLPLKFPIDVSTNLTVNAALGTDIITIADVSILMGTLDVNGGEGDDVVRVMGSNSMNYLFIDLTDDANDPGIDVVNIQGSIAATEATIKVSKNVFIGSTGSINASTGLTIEANVGTVLTTGNFKGIEVNGGTLTSNGPTTIVGRGGTGTTGFQTGVLVTSQGRITNNSAGGMFVIGTGGDANGLRNYGVHVDNNGVIEGIGGLISITGTGKGFGSASNRSHGVFVANNGIISGNNSLTVNGTGGQGSGGLNFGVVGAVNGQIICNSGTLTVNGNGGTGGGSSYGVNVQSMASIKSTSANIVINGTSHATTGADNIGVVVNATIEAGSGGNVTVVGTGSNSPGTGTGNIGVLVGSPSNDVGRITALGGNVSITGTGVGTSASSANHGVICTPGEINAGGTGSVTINGVAGAGTGNSFGVLFRNTAQGTTRVFTANGPISITGQGGAGTVCPGVAVAMDAKIEAGGTGAVTINGTGGSGSTGPGMSIETGAQITTNNGNISLTGAGSNAGDNNNGVTVISSAAQAPAQIQAGGTGSVTINGTGGLSSGNNNYGFRIGTNSTLSTNNGPINIIGQGGGAGASMENVGVLVNDGATITAGGTHSLTLDGRGGLSSGNSNAGVVVAVAATEVKTSGGPIHILGTEGTGTDAIGIVTLTTANITTQAAGGNINLTANSMKIDAPVSTNTSSTITLKPKTNGVAIELGSATDPIGGPLRLTDAELDNMATGTLIIGSATAGNITVTADINRPASTNIQLVTAGDITLATGGIATAGGNLLLDCGSAPKAIFPNFNGTDADLGAGALTFASNIAFAINGTTSGNGTGTTHTQIVVNGTVTLTGHTLVLSGDYTEAVGNVITLVTNDGTDAVIGTFTGLPQNAMIGTGPFNTFMAQISYTGGDGNDVTLTVVGPLPVELTFFGGKTQADHNLLTWETAQESNTAWHILERSADGLVSWQEIGRLASAGEGRGAQNYSMPDEQPLPNAYYRLRIEDKDGSFAVMRVVYLSRTVNEGIQSIYPSPTTGAVNISYFSEKEQDLRLQVLRMDGAVVREAVVSAQANHNLFGMDLGDLPSGMYLLRGVSTVGQVSQVWRIEKR